MCDIGSGVGDVWVIYGCYKCGKGVRNVDITLFQPCVGLWMVELVNVWQLYLNSKLKLMDRRLNSRRK